MGRWPAPLSTPQLQRWCDAFGPGEIASRSQGGESLARMRRARHRTWPASSMRIAATPGQGARRGRRQQRGFTCALLPFDIADRVRGMTGARPLALDLHLRHAVAWARTSAHFTARLGLADRRNAAHRQPVRLRIAGAALSTHRPAGSVGRPNPGSGAVRCVPR